jgi:hypothetical protein
MNSERIKEIQKQTPYPESISVMVALKQVWNECEQDLRKELYSEEDMINYAKHTSKYNVITPKQWSEQFKKK